VAKHLHAVCATASIDLVVEFLDKRTEAWRTASPRAEATISGPLTAPQGGQYELEFDVFVTLTSRRGSNDYVHVGHAGTIENALSQCILVKDYGETGLLEIATLTLNPETGVTCVHVRPAEKDEEIHSTIQARLRGHFAEN
jgi:hypothetical protein